MSIEEEHRPELLVALWDSVMALAEHQKAVPIKGKLYSAAVGDWVVAVNGADADVTFQHMRMPRFHAALFYQDMPIVLATPLEGTVMGDGENILEFAAAVKEKIAKEQK